MSKYLYFLLALSFAMVFGLVACGGSKTEETKAAETTAADEAAEEITLEVAYMPNYGSYGQLQQLWKKVTLQKKVSKLT